MNHSSHLLDLDHPPHAGSGAIFDLREALGQAAREFPTSPYLCHGQASLTFSEVAPALAQVANQLPKLAGRRVILLLPDSLTVALLHLECFLQGATVVPLSPFSPAAHIRYVLDRICADLVFTTPVLSAKFSNVLQETGVVLIANRSPSVLEVRRDPPRRDSHSEVQSSPVRAVFFTSGTTGKPKGVCLSEANLLSAASINCAILNLNSSRRSLLTVPLYDYYGAIQLYSHAFAKSACTIGESGQFPQPAFNAVRSQSITDVVLVPFTLKALMNCIQSSQSQPSKGESGRETSGGTCLDTWRHVTHIASSSDQLTPGLLQRAFALNPALTITNVYGLTEAGRACYRVIRNALDSCDSIGKPSPGMKVWVDAQPSQPGEIVIAGPTVMLGYLKEVIGEQIHFDPVRELRTSDEGYIGANGEIHLLGRKDHLMSLHGVKLHPSEIELPVNQLQGVKDSLVQLREDDDGNKTIHLSVVADRERVSEHQILDLLRERVPRLFLPQAIHFVDAIPRTEIGGKLIRRDP